MSGKEFLDESLEERKNAAQEIAEMLKGVPNNQKENTLLLVTGFELGLEHARRHEKAV